MIHELRTYTFQQGKLAEYLDLARTIGRPVRGQNYGVNLGYWTTEFGTLNQVWHLWEYESLNERARLRGELAKNERWTKEYVPAIRDLMLRQDIRFLNPIHGVTPPEQEGGIYELRIYRMKPTMLGGWAASFRDIMRVREKYSKNVGIWTGEAPQPNEAVHMWNYRDMKHRTEVRAAVAKDPEWQAFVAKGAPIIMEMQNMLLIPTDYSSMK